GIPAVKQLQRREQQTFMRRYLPNNLKKDRHCEQNQLILICYKIRVGAASCVIRARHGCVDCIG
ncbi:MAG TPA: hypothetical protein PLZ01_10300, partial [bacterium]|nr:hypothetical protein [bacterium]